MLILHPLNLLILLLATWRLSALFAYESGPFNLFQHLRWAMGVRVDSVGQNYYTNSLAEGIACVWCNSLWFGTVWTVTYYFMPDLTLWLALPLALSALSVVLQVSLDRLHYQAHVDETPIQSFEAASTRQQLLRDRIQN